jgi:DNA-directed RNA polymerase I, II, and III subunit RPABC2
MSDNDDYFSDNEDIESSDDDDEKKMSVIKKFDENTIEKILNNSDDEDDEEEDEEDKNDYYDEEKDQIGGADGDSSENEEDEDEDAESENEDNLAPKTKKSAKITIDPTLDDDDNEEDEDDEEDENYLQKFDREITKNYITDQHPECAIHNYDEIAKLSFIVRDNDNIIVDPLHKTLPFLTKYEKARTLGQRAKQIECGATPLIKVPEGIIDAHIIAELELQQKRIPFIIRRPIPGGGSEYWNLKDLDIITF